MEVFKQKKSCSTIQTIEKVKRSIIWHCGSFNCFWHSRVRVSFVHQRMSKVELTYAVWLVTLHFVFKTTTTAFNMIHSSISQVQFYIFLTSSYSTWLFINICTAIYFMYFYLRYLFKCYKNFFILLSIYEELPLRTRGASVSRNFPGNW